MILEFGKNTLILIFLFYISSNEQTRTNIFNYLRFFYDSTMVENWVDKVLYKICSSILFYNITHVLNPDSEDIFELDLNYKSNNKSEIQKSGTQKPEIKYEDKYLDEIRKMDKEYKFTDIENENYVVKIDEFYKTLMKEYNDNIEELQHRILKIETKIARYESSSDDEYCDVDEDGYDDVSLGETKEDKISTLTNEKNKLITEHNKLKELIETNEGQEEIMKNAKKQAFDYIINERLDKLSNSFIIENTPQGNVLMFWNNKRGSFEYYSDNTIPYRYLEPVGRKYVKIFNCRPIFVDMEEELKICEERLKKEKEEKELQEAEEKKRLEEAKLNNTPIVPEKKNVFAKFKTYNKEAGSGRVNMAPPPKNSIPNKSNIEDNTNELVLLKERTNRYTYEGKFSNFSFLKKVERKLVDKKFAMTFADFKKNILKK